MENNESIKQLLIIGNGFDLACGLKSSYKDFFDNYLKSISSTDSKMYWEKYFQNMSYLNSSNDDYTWTDIETQIFTQLQNVEFIIENELLKNRFYENKDELVRKIEISLNGSNSNLNFDSLLQTFYLLKSVFEYYMIGNQLTLNTALNKIKTDLLKLEDHFTSYLTNEIQNANSKIETNNEIATNIFTENSYFIKSRILFATLLLFYMNVNETPFFVPPLERLQETSDSNFISYYLDVQILSKFNIVENYVLSFNYTKPFPFPNLRNIHGNLNNWNIIFGIDYDKVNTFFSNQPTQFTKSYRILENKLNSDMTIPSDLNKILFYGHGLGEADYSYFQTIFDTVDLYHGNTKLIFFWNNFNDKDQYNIQVERVTNLIEKYGQTFTNKDHGRNLFTKLLLENRIIFEQIDLKDVWNLQYLY
jgi:hypothetical protein